MNHSFESFETERISPSGFRVTRFIYTIYDLILQFYTGYFNVKKKWKHGWIIKYQAISQRE